MKAFDIVPLEKAHAEEAANMVARRYLKLRASVPALPAAHERPESFAEGIRKLIQEGPGVAAVMDGRLVGFLTGTRIPGARVHVPEWANAVDDNLGESGAPATPNSPAASSRATTSVANATGWPRPWGWRTVLSASGGMRKLIYRRMYEKVSAEWVSAGRFTHLVTQMAHDDEGLDAWLWSGFGPLVTDAIRDLSGVKGEACSELTVRRATPDDICAVDMLVEAQERYMAGPPLFMPLLDMDSAADNLEWLSKPGHVLFLAFQGGEPVAYVKRQPRGSGTAHIVSDAKTTAITGAYTIESARSGGVATALLGALVESAREDGYEQISVDFECFNILGSRFWLRHFTPVCYSFARKIDERVAWAHAKRDRESMW